MNKANNTGEWREKHLKEPVDGWSFPPDFLREMTHAINEESNESIEMEELEVVLLHLLKLESLSTETGQQGMELSNRGKYVIIDLRNMDFMKNEKNEINYYDTREEAAIVCGMYEFENVWVCKLIYNHIEPK